MAKDIEALLKEKRIFEPPAELVENSNVKKWMNEHNIKDYDELLERAKDKEWFWEDAAKELEWFAPWTKVLEWNPPHAKWFVDGKINIVHNALDRHMGTPRENKVAYI